MRSEFTGKHMAAILVTGFAIVIAVNLTMATMATRGFGGVVVENSYVASQKFNGWLEEARRQESLGYSAEVSRDGKGHILVSTKGVPEAASASAQIRRPLGKPDTRAVTFERLGPDMLRSSEAVPEGRWTVRLTLHHLNDSWVREVPIS